MHYIKFCHINLRIFLHGTRSCVVVSVAYLKKVFIHIYLHGGIITLKHLKTKAIVQKTEGPMKCTVIYLRHKRILGGQMVIIYTKHHLAWLWLQCVITSDDTPFYLVEATSVKC